MHAEMRCLMTLLWMLLLFGVDAQEVRIPAYVNRGSNRPVVRVIPETFIVRVRKPDDPKAVPTTLRESSITRIQPVLLVPNTAPRINLENSLRGMGLRSLLSLIRAAQLQSYLQEIGPITLFAPTDEAFSLMTPPTEQDRLRQFLLQHVVRGRILPQDIRNDITLSSLRSDGTPLRLNVYEDGQMLSVSGSQFLDDAQDVGSVRIQPVDRVLYPISKNDLVTEVRLTFPRLYELLLQTSLASQLTSGTFTLFAPTDEAYDALTPEVREQLLTNPTLLRRVLLNHIVPGTHYSAVLAHGYALRTLGSEPIHFTNRRGLILANGRPVVRSDISVNNGVIHAINRLLLPPELRTMRKPATIAPPPKATIAPDIFSRRDSYTPVPTYMEPPPTVPRTLTKTMATPLQLPDGRKETFSTANALFRRSLLLTTMRKNNGSEMTYTIVMPTDAAFSMLEPGALDRMRRNSRILRRMLMCQMIEGRMNISAIAGQRDRPIRSLGGTLIISSLNGGKSLMAGGARILSVRPAANGVVLVTDRVTFPPPARSVADALTPFPTLRGIIAQQPKIQETLSSGEAAYTMFAPSDVALSSLRPEQLQDRNFMNELFWSHVVPGAYYRSRLSPTLQLTTLRGNVISINRTPTGDILANNIPLSGDEIIAGNGVIHKIDTLLFPTQPAAPTLDAFPQAPSDDDELNRIAQKYNATQFLEWMDKAKLRNVLLSQGQRTGCMLFLPTNSALNKMSPTLRVATLGDLRRLKNFIRFHISPQKMSWDSLRNNSLIPTMFPGKQIRCNNYDRTGTTSILTVSGCRVSDFKPLRSNSNVTVFVIEEAMAPPVGDLRLSVSKCPQLTNFTKIMKVAGDDEFTADGPYTIFAPDACAFTKMDPQEYQRLISNRKVAKDFIKRHMVRGCAYSNGLQDGQILFSEAGTRLQVQVTIECIIISGSRLLYGDKSCTNGVLHIMSDQLPS